MGPKSLDSERRALCDFLYYAYLPSVSEASRHAGYYAQIIRDDALETFSDESSARRLLAKIMQERINALGADQVVIGVTAGYDSRGLLGALSEQHTKCLVVAVEECTDVTHFSECGSGEGDGCGGPLHVRFPVAEYLHERSSMGLDNTKVYCAFVSVSPEGRSNPPGDHLLELWWRRESV